MAGIYRFGKRSAQRRIIVGNSYFLPENVYTNLLALKGVHDVANARNGFIRLRNQPPIGQAEFQPVQKVSRSPAKG